MLHRDRNFYSSFSTIIGSQALSFSDYYCQSVCRTVILSVILSLRTFFKMHFLRQFLSELDEI